MTHAHVDHADHGGHRHGSHDHGSEHGPGHGPDAGLGELLDLDAVALATSWERIHALVAEAAPASVRTVVDLGAGTGTGTLALARLFPAATVTAVDSDPELPGRLAAKGAGERVRALVADLDQGWPALGTPDLVWSSMALHHLADPDRTLREAFDAMAPGGLLAGVEFDEPVRVLAPGALGGLEDRVGAVLRGMHARDVPEIGSQWAQRFTAAGFTVETEERVEVDVRPPLPAPALRYAQLWLGRLAGRVAGDLEPADVAALQRLATTDGIAEAAAHGHVHLHGVRTVTLARRP